ncbi:hypothetical protein E3P92_03097 [Wallemia ichthyophaga]|uniref:Putative transport protein n=1 Tax=Wallemia ichthyophaga (strain EXF-994 / CBS 113033) TaxID=1299270 RepID=R9ACY2_WALI9|nr:putative transport protein [Wallemia ichthyophaga EXF-994]EOQ99954.1 putative transport protein [Wallemia ichthyophaga EXF-994]TIB10694.1 hypothetical protein E3P92_03097 [Wallemia ichthyophaga]TIB31502.1 hypothetical protein E3P84_02949 [Wallemia ichthyophaga]TIB40537.1 hypothetical protein E3P83_02855 [Wallemia ichthyophaga]
MTASANWSVTESITKALAAYTPNSAGLLMIALAQLFFASMSLCVKLLGQVDPPVSALELVVVRMAITGICAQSWILVHNAFSDNKIPNPILGPLHVRSLLFARGFVGFAAISALYYSLAFLDLSDVTSLGFLLPVVSGLLGWLFLNEPYLPIERYSSVVSLLGVVLIARPPFLFGGGLADQEHHLSSSLGQRSFAVAVVLLSVVGASLAYVTTRAIGTRAHPMHVILAFSWCSVVFGGLLMKALGEPFVLPKSTKWCIMLVAIGAFGFIGQILLTLGLRREKVGRASLGMYLQMVFALLFEKIFFNSSPHVLSVVGAAIIIATSTTVALQKDKKTQPSGTLDEHDKLIQDERERFARLDYGSLEQRAG